MPIPHKLTVFVLLYGDYPELARRCLGSLLSHDAPFQVRVAMNECSEPTRNFVAELRQQFPDQLQAIYSSAVNLHKYPVMRAMFHDPERPIRTPYVAWFDDDSYLSDPADLWAARVVSAMGPQKMFGGVRFMKLGGDQADWIRDQPWFGGRELPPNHRVRFVNGSYWVIDSDVIRRFGWPVAELDHRGGDVMLGELCRQQGIEIVDRLDGARFNADGFGQNDKSKRRGFDSPPIGYKYSRRVSSQVLPPVPPIPKLAVESYEPPEPTRLMPKNPFSLDL
jgi:hypothetical protein